MAEIGQTLDMYREAAKKFNDAIKEQRASKLRLAMAEDSLKLHAQRVEQLKKQSNMNSRFSSRTFDSFDPEGNKKAYEICRRYVEQEIYNEEKNSLLICGTCGTGKTHLAAAIANRLLDSEVEVLFDTYSGHLNKLKAEFENESRQKNYLNQLQNVEMLILDDVGKEKQTEWAQSVMFDIINTRYEGMRPMIITSNYGSKDLRQYFGDACYSRLVEMCNVAVTSGPDKRKDRRA